jgi:hypothetical protein
MLLTNFSQLLLFLLLCNDLQQLQRFAIAKHYLLLIIRYQTHFQAFALCPLLLLDSRSTKLKPCCLHFNIFFK